jgi:hypothetical protein
MKIKIEINLELFHNKTPIQTKTNSIHSWSRIEIINEASSKKFTTGHSKKFNSKVKRRKVGG